MKEVTISRYTASKIIKKYLEEYYNGFVNIKTKTKIKDNDLYVLVKKVSRLNHKKISEIEAYNERQIYNIIKEYMETKGCEVENILYEPSFNNLKIRFRGRLNLNNKVKLLKKA